MYGTQNGPCGTVLKENGEPKDRSFVLGPRQGLWMPAVFGPYSGTIRYESGRCNRYGNPYMPDADVYVKSESATVRIIRNPPAKLMKCRIELRTSSFLIGERFILHKRIAYTEKPPLRGGLFRITLLVPY